MEEVYDDAKDRMPLSLMTTQPEDIHLDAPIEQPEADWVELGIYAPVTHMFELENEPEWGEMILIQMGHNTVRQTVVQRDDDLLTPEQLQTHWAEVQAAMLKELQTWAKLNCFSRRQRQGASNVIDVRWVIKFKWETPTADANASGRQASEARAVRSIRARLTVRGFKDNQKNDVARYAGTSSRAGQKILVSEAVRRHWPICTADISKAFLQGMTYKEMAELTGEPLREVNFYLPASNIALLRKIPGFENFNPQTELLHCERAATGTVDAPRAFSLKLGQITIHQCKMKSSHIDPELCIRHENGSTTAVMTKHVDDLKITGKPEQVRQILAAIQAVFGELKIEWHTFTNCGVRHIQCKVTMQITLDQSEYTRESQSHRPCAVSGGEAWRCVL